MLCYNIIIKGNKKTKKRRRENNEERVYQKQ
nr:MAG TPA: hypothetical protein [Caudoviricetes sp.]